MNLSYKQSGDFQAVIEWIHQFPYPNCKKVTNLASLRNGVAIAEVLIDKLPPALHPLFLPHIEIYNTNPQRSILNLKVMLSTLKNYFANHEELIAMLEEFNAEGLYFDHNMMETFVYTILMNLESGEQFMQNDENARDGYLGVSQASDIANLSSIIINNEYRQPQKIIVKDQPEKKENIVLEQEKQSAQMQKIKRWMVETHHIDPNEGSPDQIIGSLVNSIFAGSRLDHTKIVKQSHYEQGSITVFKKVCDYLLQCERMPKQNVLTMLEEVQVGSIREEVFWAVVEDLMNLKISHNLKTNYSSRKKSISKTQEDASNKDNKENNPKEGPNIIKEKEAEKMKTKAPIMGQYSSQVILQVQNWIKNELGYEFSLNKSKNSESILENPLLNGVLLGSIVMRMQIGKVNTIKQPRNKKQIEKNLNEVTNCIIRRGIEAGRKLTNYKPTYKNYLGAIWDVKKQCQKKAELEKAKRMQKYRIKKETTKEIGEAEIESLNEWLQEKGIQLQTFPIISANKISEICGEVLELKLLRETTPKIKEINMIKILQELRRVGWQYQCTCQQVLSSEGNNIRWSILKFCRELLKYKIYYYR